MKENRLARNLGFLCMGEKKTEVAESIGKSAPTLSNYIHERAEPPLDTLLRMSDYFGISLDTLVSGSIEDSGLSEVKESSSGYGDNARLCEVSPSDDHLRMGRQLYFPGLPHVGDTWLLMVNQLHGMEPEISTGDLLAMQPADSVVQFSVCLVISGLHAYLGRVKQDVADGREIIQVIHKNPSIPTFEAARQDVTGLYKVHRVFKSVSF